MQLEILFEDKDIIVCYKPSGIPTQTSKLGEQDMVSILKNYFKGGYVAVIHRLDQPVEGILVFAKSPYAAKEEPGLESITRQYFGGSCRKKKIDWKIIL